MNNCYGIILAAGEGKRMKSNLPKVLHKVCGKAMVEHVINALHSVVDDYTIVVGHGADKVKGYLGDKFKFSYQDKQLGTGHAVMCAEEFLKGKRGTVIILAGDTPLVTSKTISEVFQYHIKKGYSATVITGVVENPKGYGRIVRDSEGNLERIVEDKDANELEKQIKEVNSGAYCFDIEDLLNALKRLNNNNAQGEYYLTDVIEILKNDGKKVGAYVTDFEEFTGVNSRSQLYQASVIMRNRIISKLMEDGVTFIDPNNTYVDVDVKIGRDTIIYPGTILEGNTKIGENCIIGPNTRLVNVEVEDFVTIQNSVVLDSKVMQGATVGPFAYVRPESVIGKDVKIGDFVEIKKSVIGDGTKVSHLTYIGDAEVGKGCNFGCGTVVVNYDGSKKHKTVVKDNAFIGCNTNLVAPLTVGENAYIAAGSTITEDVPDGALAIARERQVNKEGWVEKKGIWKK
ncbi:bifunctional UDP-N-acetylglucosamine pyrophosphorylase / Glucosamine-1-phosphate N-acetyltransferase [Caloramator fervidus]|uniref:Bifunctional protein GlmU n=1 Tax=Caloramator fervidus TaxID=29344 RepID=A0A1H5UWA0_9CLOT|nr:bifunctional UDP-N-acetylglucosamine diphosphorylase/glucosamine-1-phosphate N-acetyltransferase GlmU [Caloramator fervidus]SEF79442.1 bifunctional UDP-N-acetylglucosamine pyrophosphorylase / Glucosamine-1-phosphate N-acetyltransferase [Caloramator fervidus]